MPENNSKLINSVATKLQEMPELSVVTSNLLYLDIIFESLFENVKTAYTIYKPYDLEKEGIIKKLDDLYKSEWQNIKVELRNFIKDENFIIAEDLKIAIINLFNKVKNDPELSEVLHYANITFASKLFYELKHEDKARLEKIESLENIILKANKTIEDQVNAEYVISYGENFDYFNERSKIFLKGSIICAVILLVIIVFSRCLFKTDNYFVNNVFQLSQIPNILSKVSIFSILIYVLFFCIKNYNINSNLAYNYKQAEVALKTYRTFISTVNNAEDQKMLALEISKNIFQIRDAGFLKQTEEEKNTLKTSDIIALIRTIGGSK